MNSLKIFAVVLVLSTTIFGYSLYASTSADEEGSALKTDTRNLSEAATFTATNDFQQTNNYADEVDQSYSAVSASDAQIADIKPLLKQAENAYWKLQLTTPEYDNAYSYYQRVLAIQPGNVAAEVGIQRVVDKYIELADDVNHSGRRNTAKTYLEKALTINPNSVRAKELLARIEDRRELSSGYTTISSAKEAYRAGKISKPKYQQIVRRLKTAMGDKIRHLKLSYKSGKIDKNTYSQKVRQVKTRYQ